jgi:hypothetical protein
MEKERGITINMKDVKEQCDIHVVVVAKRTFCVCKGSGGIRMDGTCARCNKPLELADNNA